MAVTEGHFEEIALVEIYEDENLNKVQDSLLITPSFGAIWYTDLDFGYPTIRESVSDLPDDSGTYDETRYHGSRSVSLSLVVLDKAFDGIPLTAGWDPSINWDSAGYWVSRLAGWMLPAKRYALHFRRKGQEARWMDIRPAGMSAPVTMDQRGTLSVQMQWVCPSGRMYSWNDAYNPALTSQTATKDGRHRKDIKPVDSSIPGREYPEPDPYVRDYPARPKGTDSVLYSGTAPNGFVVNLRAEGSNMVDPRVEVFHPNGSLAGSIGLTYTVAAGDYVHIDSTAKTVSLNGPARSDNRLNQYLTAPTKWPVLNPGRDPLAATNTAKLPGYNRIDFSASEFDEGAFAEVQWFDAYIL